MIMSNWDTFLSVINDQLSKVIAGMEGSPDQFVHFCLTNDSFRQLPSEFLTHYKAERKKDTRRNVDGQVKKLITEATKAVLLGNGSGALSIINSCIREYNLVSKLQQKILLVRESALKLPEFKNKSQEKREIPEVTANEEFPSASNLLHLQRSDDKGRYVVCDANIAAGSVLFVENPVASVVLKDWSHKLCNECCRPIISSVPCLEVEYCSVECNKIGESYHQYECGYLSLLYSLGIAHLALRSMLSAGSLFELKSQLLATHEVRTAYTALYLLKFHPTKMRSEEMFSYAMTAVLLTEFLLTETTYFEGDDSEEAQLLVASSLLRHMLQLVCNAHAMVLNCQTSKSGFLEIRSLRVATGIFTSTSMMNHSCSPNIVTSYIGKRIIVRAARDLEKGEEVFNCYGPHCARMERWERQNTLAEQYNFYCKCSSCESSVDPWDMFHAYKCRHCAGALIASQCLCLSCGQYTTVTRSDQDKYDLLVRLYEKGMETMENDDLLRALEILMSTWKSARTFLHSCHELVLRLADSLAQCLAKLGYYYESLCILVLCQVPIRLRFGHTSPEIAHELSKLRDVARRTADSMDSGNVRLRNVQTVSHRATEEMKAIFYLLYGCSDIDAIDLDNTEEILP